MMGFLISDLNNVFLQEVLSFMELNITFEIRLTDFLIFHELKEVVCRTTMSHVLFVWQQEQLLKYCQVFYLIFFECGKKFPIDKETEIAKSFSNNLL